jgi:hypothetical protein
MSRRLGKAVRCSVRHPLDAAALFTEDLGLDRWLQGSVPGRILPDSPIPPTSTACEGEPGRSAPCGFSSLEPGSVV